MANGRIWGWRVLHRDSDRTT